VIRTIFLQRARRNCEECDWFAIGARPVLSASRRGEDAELQAALNGFREASPEAGVPEQTRDRRRQFFAFSGPLFSVAISPASTIMRVDLMASAGRIGSTKATAVATGRERRARYVRAEDPKPRTYFLASLEAAPADREGAGNQASNMMARWQVRDQPPATARRALLSSSTATVSAINDPRIAGINQMPS